MKIVGRMDGGYLCQMTEDEIGVVTGFGSHPRYGSDEKTEAFLHRTGRPGRERGEIPTNTEISVVAGLAYIEGIRSRVTTVSTTARTLRELADMLEKPIPSAIEPPDMDWRKLNGKQP